MTTGELPNLNPETIGEHDQMALLSSLGNHEAKLLTAAIILSDPDETFTTRQLHNRMIHGQGDAPAWPMNPSVPIKYCLNSLAPIGTVVQGEVLGERGPVKVYQATEMGSTSGLAFTGALLKWSLDHPDLSLMQAFGQTASSSVARSPVVRHQIYLELLTAPDGAIAYTDIADSLVTPDMSKKMLDGQLRDLATLGIIDIKSTLDEYDPLFKINNPVYEHVAIPFNSLKVETQATYRAMQSLFDRKETEVDLSTFIAEAVRLNPEVNVHALRKRLTQGINDMSKNFPGLELTNRSDIPRSSRTNVSLNPSFADAISELCAVLEDVFSGNNAQSYRDQARQVVSDSKSFNALMRKVKNSSPNIVAQTEGREGLNKRLLSIIEALGTASVKDVVVELESQSRKLGKDAVSSALGALYKQGAVVKRSVERSATNRSKINMYELPRKDGIT